MNKNTLLLLLFILFFLPVNLRSAGIGTRFPSERKVVVDAVTGQKLYFLTSRSGMGDSKIYQTHNQWTSDGQWIVFRSNRVPGEAMAVNEKSGILVQITEGGYTGMLNVARKSMKLYFMRNVPNRDDTLMMEWRKNRPLLNPDSLKAGEMPPALQFAQAARDSSGERNRMPRRLWIPAPRKVQVMEVDLAKLFTDSEAGRLQPVSAYERICGTTPESIQAGGDMALDGGEEWAYFRIGKEEAARHLPDSVKIEDNYGPRHMGAGPSGIARMNLLTGEVSHVVSVPFQVGHIQGNSWTPGELVFCWETGGKAPQRTWYVRGDGSGLKPLYPESPHEWITHEAVIGPDEVAFAMMGHRPILKETKAYTANPANPGQESGWGDCGTRAKPTGLGIVNIRTGKLELAGQTAEGSGFWHVAGSADGRWVVGDDFARNLYLIDRKTHEMMLLTTGHKTTASDHPHPTFSPDGTRVEFQSALLSEDGKSMNICVVAVPKNGQKRSRQK